ncbi:MAG: helix-turn-helix domain-containing protein, partial [Chitinophagaceae bacterium]
MVKLGILLTQHHRLLSVAAVLDVFETVNKVYNDNSEDNPFEISFIGDGTLPGYGSHPVINFNTEYKYDLILVPSFHEGKVQEGIPANARYIPFLRTQYGLGAEIGSFCSGAFLLAATGLLDHKPATTHINAVMQFKKAFPLVKLEEESVCTHEEGIFTSGGATNSFHLMFRLISKYCSREMSVKVAKIFAIDLNREQQGYFNTAPAVQEHEDELVKQAQKEIEKYSTDGKTIEEILKEVPASRRNLVRRFKNATGITPIELLQKLRIDTAKALLENSQLNIQQVMVESGYNDVKAFRALFKKQVGLG